MPRVTKAQKKVHIVSFSNDIVKMIADRFDLHPWRFKMGQKLLKYKTLNKLYDRVGEVFKMF